MAESEQLSKRERKISLRKKVVIETAFKLFSQKHFEEVTMDEIADKAALSKTTLYKDFYSKEGIYYAIGLQAFKEVNDRLEGQMPAELPGIELIKIMIDELFRARIAGTIANDITHRLLAMDQETASIITRSLSSKEKLIANQKRAKKTDITVLHGIMADYLEQLREYVQFWEKAIVKGQKDGSISANLTSQELTLLVFHVVNGIIEQLKFVDLIHYQNGFKREELQKLTIEMITKFLTSG
ncbi:MAG: TetR/AcrR family transcriptional regulator [Candidatus Odinarchaeota archaeon]